MLPTRTDKLYFWIGIGIGVAFCSSSVLKEGHGVHSLRADVLPWAGFACKSAGSVSCDVLVSDTQAFGCGVGSVAGLLVEAQAVTSMTTVATLIKITRWRLYNSFMTYHQFLNA